MCIMNDNVKIAICEDKYHTKKTKIEQGIELAQ